MEYNLLDLLKSHTLYDCTMTLSNEMPIFGDQKDGIQHKMIQPHSQGYFLSHFSFQPGSGTHIDAPYHFFDQLRKVEDIPQQEMISQAFVIDIQKQCQNPDYQLTVKDIQHFEKKHKIFKNSFVLAKTGWSSFLQQPKYKNEDVKGVYHFPGFSLESVEYLNNLEVQAIGIDTLSLDPGNSEDLPVHTYWLKLDKFQIENVDLQQVKEGFYDLCVIAPMKIKDAGESACKVLLFKQN